MTGKGGSSSVGSAAAETVRAATIVELLGRSQATVDHGDGEVHSCAEILTEGRRIAAALSAAGFAPGDRIAVQMPNGALYVHLLAAAAVGGYVLMAVNARFDDRLAASIVDRSGARLLVRTTDDLPAADASSGSASAQDREEHARRADDRFVIFTTSGTTSAPKLVVHQQYSITEHGADVAEAFDYSADSVILIPLPLAGVFGFTSFWAGVAGNARILLPPSFDADATGRLIASKQVAVMHGSDDMFHRLLQTEHDLSSLECCGYARFNSALDGIVERSERRGVPLAGLYGMSEVQALFASRGGPARSGEDRWRAGGELVSSRAQYRVVDGELQLRGPSLFEGYLADGGDRVDLALTAEHYDDGWFCTGDLAAAEGTRSFEYIARLGDAMRLGGYLVAPAEIEAVLMELDSVDQAQVVAVDRTTGARPVAFVILTAGHTLDEAAIIRHCRSELAIFKCPVRVVALDEFPVTDGPNGVKIQRSKLRERGQELLGAE